MHRKFRVKCTALIAVLLLIISCNSKKEESAKRPIENWVFRSVLDKNPRMVTAALNENLWLAYNTQTASLYKAWKGGVNFDGAVYTTKHGPQPTSLGYAYANHTENWVLTDNGKELPTKIQYKGHKFSNGEVTFNYQLIGPNSEVIKIEETPKYIKEGDKNGLERSFKISNNSSYEILLKTTISSLESNTDYNTNGEFIETNTENISFDDGEILEIEGSLKLNKEVTTLSIYFHPGFDKLEKNNNLLAPSTEEVALPLGAQHIKSSDCVACHNETKKTVGPAYLTIAEKYADDDATQLKLAEKIKNGGSGVWGAAAMTPHPNIDDKVLNDMVKYILSLDDNQEKDGEGQPVKYTLGEKSIPLDFKEDLVASSGKGLIANLYIRDPYTQEKVYSKAPIKNAITNSIHVLDADDFGGHDVNIKVVFQGEIHIAKTDSYSFRLISDDGSYLFIDDKEVVDNGGDHGFNAVDGETYLKEGKHKIRIPFQQGGGGAGISLQWFNKESKKFELIKEDILSYSESDFVKAAPFVSSVPEAASKKPGDQIPLEGVHPSFTLHQARPDNFEPKVGGLDFMADSTIVLSTWDPDGSVYFVKNYMASDPKDIEVKKIATGLAEPLGVKVVDGEIYVLQKQELTKLIDHDGDQIIDEYQTVSNAWKVSGNFHEFAFGLVYKDGFFYASLATAILPGGASADPQIQDRGKVVKINPKDGSIEFIASGLRTPNGLGLDTQNEIFLADNQGDWLPASKIVHIQKGKFYGSRSVDYEGTEDVEEKLPVVWLPQDEIGNSPSQPTYLNIGPYKNQLIHGEVTHGGIKRVAYEEIEGQLQGAVFRFTQGIEAGVNRIVWAPDGSLLIGGIGVSGNWLHYGKLNHGLQRMKFNGNSTFEMLKINALSNGFEIEFTEPIAEGVSLSKKDFEVQQWYYLPTKEYGGPKMDKETLSTASIKISKDRKKVFIPVNGMKENHVVYFHLNPELKGTGNTDIWTTEAWYTLNKIPVNKTITKTAY